MSFIAPDICLGCGQEGAVLCNICMFSAGDPHAPYCAGCKKLSENSKTCSSCRSWLLPKQIFVATVYDSMYEDLVRSFKFKMRRRSVLPMAKMMADVTPDVGSEVIICQIPTASSRVRQRGFDHAKLLALQYRRALEEKYPEKDFEFKSILGRNTNIRQLGAARAQRIKQMQKEFYVKDESFVRDKSFLLVDDVMTTGASVAAAAKTLKAAGAKHVYAVIFAQKI